ncbi:MAG: penicillin-binding protein activator LpoB [Planctomycetes bacterium]|nr:penicillin-binding protein activator LpoB [Planctomycetota bacterium]
MTRYPFCISLLFCVAAALTGPGCRTGPDVQRTDPAMVVDYSGRWNDTDAQLVARAMTEDCLVRPWIEDFKASHGGQKPVVVVGQIRNNSHEHINTEVFTTSFERELLNSSRVRVVAESQLRADIREERRNIQANSDPETIKKFGKEIGADFILLGVVSTIKDEVEGRYAIYYQSNFELIHIETNEKVWIGEHKIKKDIKRKAWKL